MAYDVTGMADYAKSNGQILIADLILGGQTFNLEGIGVQEGIKSSDKMVDFSIEGQTYLQLSNGDPGALSFSGGTTLLDVTISVTELAMKEKYPTNTLNTKITQLQQRAGSDPSNPLPFADVLVGLKKQAVGANNDMLLWQGDTATGNTDYRTNKIDGWTKKVLAGSPVTGATSGALASGTCIAVMDTFVNLAFESFPAWFNNGSFLYMSPANFATYYKAIYGLGSVITNQTLNTQALPASFIIPGTKVLVQSCDGLIGSNYKFHTRAGNFVIGTDLVSEDDKMTFTYDGGSMIQAWVLQAVYKLGAQVARTAEVVIAA